MATNFPASLDTLTNPTSSDSLSSPSHSAQHANVNDAVEAIETALLDGAPLHIDDANERVGVGNTSPSYKLDVTGDINASADLRIGGTAIGETTSYTPTISAVGGSGYTFTLIEAQYAQVNELYVAWFRFEITAGTGSGEFRVTLPTARASVIAGNARELAVNGWTWTGNGTATPTEASFSRYDNAGGLASGQSYSGFVIFGA